jgi:parvulin-like peptidyl-prolyl isomerase
MVKNGIKIALTSLLLVTVSNGSESYGNVNGEEITKEEIAQVMGPQAMQFDKLDKNIKKRVINMLVDRKLLAQNASKSGVEKSDTYKTKLEAIKKDLLLNVWMEKEAKKIEKSTIESELKSFYDKHRDTFKRPAQLKARHILVKSENEAKEIIKTLEGAKDIKAEFIKLAKEKSTGPSGKNGGDLGWFPLNRMVPEFSKATNELKQGEFTKEPVKTQFGYHVIYLEDKRDASEKSFKDVKEQVKALVTRDKFNKFIEETIKKLKKEAKIKLKEI